MKLVKVRILNQVTEDTSSFDGTLDDITEGTINKHFTATDETKLSGIEAGAEVNVNADWNAVSGDALISNKPTIPTLPSIATGSEVDTGTDNTKMVTPKAMEDSSYAKTSAIPTALSSLSEDTTHRVVTDTEKTTWNGKADASHIHTGTLIFTYNL